MTDTKGGAMGGKLTVRTEVGTFSRRTARDYRFVVVSRGLCQKALDAGFARRLALCEKNVSFWKGICDRSGYWAVEHQGQDGTNGQRLTEARERLSDALSAGPERERETFGVLGWASRIDLAAYAVSQAQAKGYADVRIYDLDGARVF